jgi:serine/threonine-protein kinase HipA
MSVKEHFGFAKSDDNPQAFLLSWYGHAIGYFKMGGVKEWHPFDPAFENLFVMDKDGKLPMFLNNLKPEGWLKDHLDYSLQTDYLKHGKRFLSNIVIYAQDGRLDLGRETVIDERLASLGDFIDMNGIFMGEYKVPQGLNSDPHFEDFMIKYWQNKHMPRFSGAELKFPTCLTPNGTVDPALNTPFNVIAKYPGAYGYEALGVNEFLGMKMAKAVGLETPAFALADQGDGLPPVYLIERYDIPMKDEGKPTEWLITQDFCTLLQVPGDDKCRASIEQIGKKIAEVSKLSQNDHTNKNLEELFKRAAFSWVMSDGDLHMKNMSLLYKFDPQTKTLTDITFAPTYDTTTDVFVGKHGVDSSLNMGGKKNKITMKTLMQLANTLGVYKGEDGKLDEARVTGLVTDMARTAAQTAIDFAHDMPAFIKDKPWTYDVHVQVSAVVDRARGLGVEGLDWDSESVWKQHKEKGPLARKAHQEMLERSGEPFATRVSRLAMNLTQ